VPLLLRAEDVEIMSRMMRKFDRDGVVDPAAVELGDTIIRVRSWIGALLARSASTGWHCYDVALMLLPPPTPKWCTCMPTISHLTQRIIPDCFAGT